MIKKTICILAIFGVTLVHAQDSFRVMTYNILNYPSKIASTRNPYFKTVIDAANPDILVVQEIESISGVNQFSQNVLDSNYTAGEFIDGRTAQGYDDTDNALFYKHSKFTFIENYPIDTQLRDISQFTLKHISTGDTLIIFSAHLKASSGSTNEQKRLAEVKLLRAVTDKLSTTTEYMIVGDFNLYKGSEPAFKELIDQTNSGYFVDPIDQNNSWHDNPTFKAIHTQSTRTTNLSDNGSTGGLDDRFDFILVSESLIDTSGMSYIPESYTSFGNDDRHLNKSLLTLPNYFVSDEIATALYYSSDHLPVYADFQIETLTAVENEETGSISNQFKLSQNYPNPFNPTTKISYSVPLIRGLNNTFVNLTVYNSMGEKVKVLVNERHSVGNYQVEFNGEGLSSGIYFYTLKTANYVLTKKMLLLK